MLHVKPLDVLYRVRPGRNEQLRYSLRSLANVPHGEVVIVGYPPKWVRAATIITPRQWRTKWRALNGDLALACAQLTGRRMILIDDDMMIVRPRDEIETLHNGELRAAAERKAGTYGRTLSWTADYLVSLGMSEPLLSYELHMPFVFDVDVMLAALEPIIDYRRPLQARTLYGNIAQIGGREATDVKLREGPMPTDYLSTDSRSFEDWLPQLRRLFSTPSEYER